MKHRVYGILASTLGPLVVRLLCCFLRVEARGLAHIEALRTAGQPYILANWHSRLLYLCYYPKTRGTWSLVSQSRDGEYIARVMRAFGHRGVRGSSSRGGARALVELVRHLRDGDVVNVTVDGPRGPAEVVKPGVIELAAKSGAPIVPLTCACRPAWRTRSWDRFMVPRGHGRAVVFLGEPIPVPAGLDEAGREAKRRELEVRLRELTRKAECWWDRDAAIPQD